MLDGKVLLRAEAYGKHLFHWWDDGSVVHVHLGLFGKFSVSKGAEPPPPVGQIRMRLSSDEMTVDLRGPTACDLGSPDDRDAIVDRLGPDPLRPDADPERFVQRITRSKQRIGQLLMDQSVAAGVGNVYRAESLFVLGIHPDRPGRDLSADEATELWTTVSTMLEWGVKEGRIVTVDPDEFGLTRRQLTGAKRTYVYRQPACLRCGTPVVRWDMAGRWCYACPTCQPS